jgi:hypothetical protein
VLFIYFVPDTTRDTFYFTHLKNATHESICYRKGLFCEKNILKKGYCRKRHYGKGIFLERDISGIEKDAFRSTKLKIINFGHPSYVSPLRMCLASAMAGAIELVRL